MTIIDLFNSIKTAELENNRVFTKYREFCYSDPDKLEKTIKEIDLFMQNLLDIKKKAKEIHCIQSLANCNPYKFYVEIHLCKGFSQLSMRKKYDQRICIEIYSIYSRNTFKYFKNDEKYKHIYKIIRKTEEFGYTEDSEYIDNYDFFIYTINRLIDFLKVAKQEAQENLNFLKKEIC